MLAELIFFVVSDGDVSTDVLEAERFEGVPVKHRQKIMRELNVIQALVDLLYYPFIENETGEERRLESISPQDPYTKICILCYRLIKHIVKDYRLNELFASQWIDLFLQQAMSTKQENNIRAEATIAELVSNNRVLLEKQIKKKTIEDFVDLCVEQQKHERFIILLTALCSCQGEAVITNQDHIIF